MNEKPSITYLRLVPISARNRTWLVISDLQSIIDIKKIRGIKGLENAAPLPPDKEIALLAKHRIGQVTLIKHATIGYLIDDSLPGSAMRQVAIPGKLKGEWDVSLTDEFFASIAERSLRADIAERTQDFGGQIHGAQELPNSLVAKQIKMGFTSETALPALPLASKELLRLRSHPDAVSVDTLTEVILEDPVLAGRMCTIANYVVWRGGKPPTSDLTQAIMRVGTENALVMALGIILISAFNIPKSQQVHFDFIWGKAQTLCSIARAVAKRMSAHGVHPSEACLVGLISVLGSIGLLCIKPELAIDLQEAVSLNRHLPQSTVEINTIGMTTSRITSIILEKWRLPVAIQQAIEDSTSEEKCLSNPLAAAHRIALMLYGIKTESMPFPAEGGLDPLLKHYNISQDIIDSAVT